MARSQLETHLDILEVLVAKPLEFTIILCQVDASPRALETHLDFLITQGLVERLPLEEKRWVYIITGRGLAVLDTLRAQAPPAREEPLLTSEG
jgi:predicted transcriptional regulator